MSSQSAAEVVFGSKIYFLFADRMKKEILHSFPNIRRKIPDRETINSQTSFMTEVAILACF